MMKSRSFLQSCARKKYIFVLLLAVLLLVGGCDYPLTFKDDAGVRITLLRKPVRVVSLVPSVTEIIYSLGAGPVLVGTTHHSRAAAARCSPTALPIGIAASLSVCWRGSTRAAL